VQWKISSKHCCLFFVAILYSGSISAHGGVEIIGNQCILTVGPFQMLFTGYQPTISNEAFCDDIPSQGDTIIALDFIDKVLRTMSTDYRVIKDIKGLGLNATIDTIGDAEEIKNSTVLYIPPQSYIHGTFSIEHHFPNGKYIGIVTVIDKQTSRSYYSVFPFTVGQAKLSLVFIGGVIFLILLATSLIFNIKKYNGH